MNRVLARQLRRLNLDVDEPPADPKAWRRLLERVGGNYDDADRGRYLLERSLRVSSEELLEANRQVKELSLRQVEYSEARYRDLFNLSRIPTWEENFSKAAEAIEELRAQGVTDLEVFFKEYPEVLLEIISHVEVTKVNPAVARLLRSPDPSSLTGRINKVLVSEPDPPSWISQMKAIWDGVGSLKIDPLVGHRLDGEEFHGILEWHAPLVEDRFDYSRVVVTIIDITDRIEAQRQMQDVLNSKDEFLASISHELRTPLTSVLGFAEVLRTMGDQTDEEEKNSLLEIIATQASDLSDIVEDLLVSARAELGRLTVVAVPVDVYAQAAQVVESRHGGESTIAMPERPKEKVAAIGDPQRIRQILRNLITNAAKYGGSEVRVEVESSDGDVLVRVCDDGQGLSPDLSEKVFDRYYRQHDDDGQPGSVGIGLTISRDLARMMSGDLFYEQRADQTVFTLRLPRAT